MKNGINPEDKNYYAESIHFLQIPNYEEKLLNERIEKIGEIIYSDNVMAGHDHLVLLVIMNSAFRFYAQLIGALNR